MDYTIITHEVADHVATETPNRPHKLFVDHAIRG